MIRPEPGHCQRCEKWSPCLSRTDDGWLCEQCRGSFGWNVLEVSLFLSAMALRLRECDSRYGDHLLITWVEVDEDSRTIRITQEVPEWLIWRDP